MDSVPGGLLLDTQEFPVLLLTLYFFSYPWRNNPVFSDKIFFLLLCVFSTSHSSCCVPLFQTLQKNPPPVVPLWLLSFTPPSLRRPHPSVLAPPSVHHTCPAKGGKGETKQPQQESLVAGTFFHQSPSPTCEHSTRVDGLVIRIPFILLITCVLQVSNRMCGWLSTRQHTGAGEQDATTLDASNTVFFLDLCDLVQST